MSFCVRLVASSPLPTNSRRELRRSVICSRMRADTVAGEAGISVNCENGRMMASQSPV